MTKLSRKFNRKNNFVNPVKQRNIKLGQHGINILLFALILFVGLSYLYFTNQTATGGFDIKGMENQITEMEKDNRQLEIKTTEMQALQLIENASENLEMVATTSIEYLPAVGSTVAIR